MPQIGIADKVTLDGIKGTADSIKSSVETINATTDSIKTDVSATKSTIGNVKDNTETLKSYTSNISTRLGQTSDASSTTTVFGWLSRIYSYFTTYLNTTRIAKIDNIDTTISSRQAAWGAVAGTKTNIDNTYTNVGSNSDASSATGSVHAKLKDIKVNLPTSKQKYTAVFESSGTWTAPTGVTQVFVTACGAGGGGVGYDADNNLLLEGLAGGVTSFGALLSLSGGGKGDLGTIMGSSGGHISGEGTLGKVYNNICLSKGGDSIFAAGSFASTAPPKTNNGRGTGGAGCIDMSYTVSGGAGAGVIDYPLNVSPGTAYTITIGAGGAGGAGPFLGAHGQRGGDGYMIIEWYA